MAWLRREGRREGLSMAEEGGAEQEGLGMAGLSMDKEGGAGAGHGWGLGEGQTHLHNVNKS